MKKYILSEQQIAFIYFSALAYIIFGSLVSIIGSRLGYLKPNTLFAQAMDLKDNLLIYVIAPIVILIKIIQLIGYLPKNKAFFDYYPPEEYPKLNVFRRYGKVVLGVFFLLLIINLIVK